MTYLVEITLIQKLFENINQFGKSRISLFEVFDQLGGSEAVGHVEGDVHPDPGGVVGQLDDGNGRPEKKEFFLKLKSIFGNFLSLTRADFLYQVAEKVPDQLLLYGIRGL